ncbi:MAG: hypothetical protein ISS78_07640, partial [Phycisphaerae bacterium]|nr:hypothetical protein [Phycisphaerae bacterium]
MRPATHPNVTTVMVLLASVCVASGCANFRVPRIDPTGERVFVAAPPRFEQQPAGRRVWDNVDLIVSPRETIAPVGSEVVLIAGVLGPDQYLTTNERVEWTMAPGGVGEIVQVGQGTWVDLLMLDFTRPKKINATWAVGSTSRKYVRLTRGTLTATDDVCVHAGQTWVAVSSPVEGTSCVTAYAPSVYGWDRHRHTAVIHWVDAQWTFPPPAINPVGTRHLFTTTVSRHTDGSPCAGWLVRYEIAEGPPAGFAPDGTQAIEVQTDQLGQATVEIFQQQPAPGTNQVNIQAIRPAGVNGGGKRLVVGSGSTLKTWSAPVTAPAIDLKVTGPAQVTVGDQVRFEMLIANRSGVAATGLVIKDSFDAGLEHAAASGAIERPLDDLAPGGFHRIHVTFRAAKAGQLCHTVEVRGNEGVLAAQRVCVTALGGAVEPRPKLQPQPKPQPKAEVKPSPAARPSLSVHISGPASAAVGQSVLLEIELINTGTQRVTDVGVVASFDSKLRPEEATKGFVEDKSRGV